MSYVDDIVVFAKDIDVHYRKLEKVFDALRKSNLKIKLEKCAFFKKEVTFLGFLISGKGITVDPEKI